MAWTNGSYFLAGGQTVSITFWWGEGDDMGPQWAMAHPIPFEPDVPLITERVAKKLVCEFGQVVQNGEPHFSCAGTGSNYEYQVWIKNDGTSGCKFQLQGGGV
jgi:hypothetical protein